jgi:putative redox protein
MMDATVTWRGRMSFTGSSESGFSVPLGTSPEVGGDNDGFKPMELLATGMAGCTAMDVISILGKKRQDVTGFEVQVHSERAEEHPKVFTSMEIEYLVSGHGVDEAAVQRAIELSAVRYCPAQAMFSQLMPIRLKYHIFEDEGDGKRREVVSREFSVAQPG